MLVVSAAFEAFDTLDCFNTVCTQRVVVIDKDHFAQ